MVDRIDFSREVEPETAGMSREGVKYLAHVFEDQLKRKHWHPAAQLVVLRHGRVILDRALGVGRHGKPVDRDTPFYCFSVSKPFTGMCVHKLIEAGKIEMDAPIAQYWPEWGCKGKETATIRHAFLHQAGIPAPHLYRQVLSWANWPRLMRIIAGYQAEFQPGTKTAYHMLNYGFILGEVVRRVAGQTIDIYFKESFADPLGLAHTRLRSDDRMLRQSPRLYSLCKENRNAAFLFNLPVIRKALIPAASLTSSARGLAVFFQMLLNGGEYHNQQLVKKITIQNAIRSGYLGYDEELRINMHYGYGFLLGNEALIVPDPVTGRVRRAYGSRSSLRTFGGLGLGSSMVWADGDAGLVVAFTCNGLHHNEITGERWEEISDAVWEAIE